MEILFDICIDIINAIRKISVVVSKAFLGFTFVYLMGLIIIRIIKNIRDKH